MKKILVIGAGNIGLRHIESLGKSDVPLKIYIYDLVISSEIKKKISVIQKLNRKIEIEIFNKLKSNLNFHVCIISTNAKERYKLTLFSIKNLNIKNIILEKIAFQSRDQYKKIISLSKQNKINIYVNCPRRSYKIFINIKNKIKNKTGVIRLSYLGKNWGICSNSIHFFDLLMFFTKFKKQNLIKYNLNNIIIRSKRKNYFELKGRIEILNKNYHLILEDSKKYKENIFKIELGKIYYIIKYDKSKQTNVLISNIDKLKKIDIPLQSNLTLQQVKILIKKNSCELTKLKDYFNYQNLLIKLFNKKFSLLFKKRIKYCPIT